VRILFLTHRLPYAPNRGDRVRAFHILRTLAARMDVELVSLVHDADEEAQAGEMRRQGFAVTTARVSRIRNVFTGALALLTAQPLTHALLDAPGLANTLGRIVTERAPDVVLVYCSGMARFALEPPLRGRPFVLDMVDVDSCKWTALAATAPWPKRWVLAREARELARFEAMATRCAAETLVVNEREHTALAALVPSTPLRIVPNGVDVAGLRPTTPPADAPNVVFCGVMNYAPNVQAVEWFVRSAWGAVKAAHPAARLFVVGANPSASVRALATRDGSITVTGRVPDVRPYLWNAAVSIAPITTARGIQNKVIEAIAAGLPCVVTTAVMGGLPREAHAACIVSDTADTFATAVNQLLALTPDERRARAGRGDLSGLDWDVALAALPDLLASVVTRAPR
jgi:sugar transferase (PEP-CTERM/EpsH1 system associated)